MKALITALAVSALSAGAAQAGVVLSDNFNAEGGGNSVLNYDAFANWDVIGAVDVVKSGDFGITCAGGSCVDLGGSAGVTGQIVSKNTFAFNDGDIITLTFDISGNQRRGDDQFVFWFDWDEPTLINDIVQNGNQWGGISSPSLGFEVTTLAPDAPWTTYSFTGRAVGSGSFKLRFETETGADNIGPLIDNVNLAVSAAVPEPATWAMMITGFGLAGAALRRRRGAVAAA